MKDSQSLPKKNKKKFSKAHFFDTVIILFLLNIAAVTVVIFYLQRINAYLLPDIKESYREVSSVPLSSDLTSINASAEAFVVFDTSTRTVIAGKNQNLRFSPASTAKVMSAILALEYYDLNQYLTVPFEVYTVLGSKMNLIAGEEITVRDLLYGMMLPSGNDAAYTIAYYYPNGVKGLVDAMNKKANALQLPNTHFVDPAGYEDGNYTTASELARLGAYAMENSDLANIVKTQAIEVKNRTQTHTFYLSNLNELLVYGNVLGIKTGFTNEAGGVLLTAIRKGDSIFIVSVLKSQNRFSDTKDLMNFIAEKIEYSAPSN
ncbi:MAG: serine hydrolase [Candidatus Levybacteria bacterium]|nr:serine hydrolase [Candidatus Levybacteria bacterium]